MTPDRDARIDLGGQVAIVTGGGRGIGKAIARGLAVAGASVAVVSRSAEQLAETVCELAILGSRAVGVVADVAERSSVSSMVREAEKALGPPDLLVNNAGVSGPFGPSWESDSDDWWRCLEVNLRGPMLCSRVVLPGMIARGGGRIVNVASGAGTIAIPYLGAYVTSKTALIRLTEVLALEAESHGVKVWAIEPGTVRTAMAEDALKSAAGRRWLPWFSDIFTRGDDVPPERAASLVVTLATGRADALSGRFFTINDDVLGLAERVRVGGLGDEHTLRLVPPS
jgi:NAD(P)-dependent dehydrogenase (short-subunit alcohol dehydrogenase family)